MKRAALLIMILLFTGCALRPPAPEPEPVSPGPPVVIQPATPRTAGSLWTEREGGLFQDLKARSVGDILTVAIFERASASKEANTTTARDSSISAGINNLFGLEKSLATINSGIDPSRLIDTQFENQFEGTGRTSRREDLVATLTAQVIEVLPNNHLVIAGSKTVTVNREAQLIRLSGIVRPADISPQNIIDSKNILDARIVYTGKGVISDKQGPGWAVSFIDWLWPF